MAYIGFRWDIQFIKEKLVSVGLFINIIFKAQFINQEDLPCLVVLSTFIRFRCCPFPGLWTSKGRCYISFYSYCLGFGAILIIVAAAKSLQSCPTLCDPRDCSPPGSHVPGILQARTLEWVAISSSSASKWKVKVKLLSHVRLVATPWTAAHQAPTSMGFSRQEYWSLLVSHKNVILCPVYNPEPCQDGTNLNL